MFLLNTLKTERITNKTSVYSTNEAYNYLLYGMALLGDPNFLADSSSMLSVQCRLIEAVHFLSS